MLHDKIPDKIFFRDSLLINRQAIKDENLQTTISRLKNPIKEQFLRFIFNQSQDWRSKQQQDENANYFYLPKINLKSSIQNLSVEQVNETSLAEVSERILQNTSNKSIVINFCKSKFSKSDLTTIFKIQSEGNKELIEILTFEDKDSLETWLELEYEFSKSEYDYDSQIPPTDQQTILRDTTKFKATSYKVQGRTVYEELKDGTYWYVDNLHEGKASHIEVFNPKEDKHIGEASLEGDIDELKADEKKKIKRYLS
jgi:hypothetical protein